MNRADRIIQVVAILGKKYPRMDIRELMELSLEIVMATTSPKTKITEPKPKPVYDNGGRGGY